MRANAKEVWRFKTENQVSSSPVIYKIPFIVVL